MEERKLKNRKEKLLNANNLEPAAFACSTLGDFYNGIGKYEDALKEYKQCAKLFTRSNNELEAAKANRMIGEMYMVLCKFDDAKEHINSYLTTAKQLRCHQEEQRAYITIGRVYLLQAQSLSETMPDKMMDLLKQAEKAFLKSLLLTKELTGKISKLEIFDMQARCYLNIGVVMEHMGNFKDSIMHINKAINVCKSHDIYDLCHLCYISLCLLYDLKQNDAITALRYCNMALEIAKRLPNRVKKICETLITKSEILIRQGDFASAKCMLKKAYRKNTPDKNDFTTIEKMLRIVVKICQTLDELVTADSMDYEKRKNLFEKLGDGCCYLNNYTKAIEYYKSMLENAQLSGEKGKSLIPIYVSLYETYKDNKQYDESLKYLWYEYDLNKDEPVESFTTLCNIAEVSELEKLPFWTIMDIYQKAKECAAKANAEQRSKLEIIVFVRLKNLFENHKMELQLKELKDEAKTKGINLSSSCDNSDTETDDNCDDDAQLSIMQSEKSFGADICLDNLTDSDASDSDETERVRPHRTVRGKKNIKFKRNNKGETPLHEACIAGNISLVRHLLDQGHPVNVRDFAGWTPLHEACNHGYDALAELLLDRGAATAINDKGGANCDGITPLYDACSNGFLDVVKLLLKRGADTTLKTDFGATCLDGLDQWRKNTLLNCKEQAEYMEVRAAIMESLTKLGITRKNVNNPLTNGNVIKTVAETESEDETTDEQQESEEIQVVEEEDAAAPLPERSAAFEYKNTIGKLRKSKTENSFEGFNAAGGRKHRTAAGNVGTKAAFRKSKTDSPYSFIVDDDHHGEPQSKRRCYSSPMSLINRNGSNQTKKDGGKVPTYPKITSHIDRYAGQRNDNKNHVMMSQSLNYETEQNSVIVDENYHHSNHSNQPHHNVSYNDLPTTSTCKLLITLPGKTAAAANIISFKVKVEDELLLVPINSSKLNDLTIRWLADETARRYYNLSGLTPKLRLKTIDGFAFEDSDQLNVAVEHNIILATVLEWKLTPLAQRYTELCTQLSKTANLHVKTLLECAQVPNCVKLQNLALTPNEVELIFKALPHQIIRVLNLSNNFLQDEGCRLLAKALPTLKQLKVLNLEGNLITSVGIEALFRSSYSTTNTNNNNNNNNSSTKTLISCATDCFEELNLSHNPITNTSLQHLQNYFCGNKKRKSDIIDGVATSFSSTTTTTTTNNATTSLRKLFLSDCHLKNFTNLQLENFNLTTFDCSFNPLTEDGLKCMLQQLTPCQLQSLNLSGLQPVHLPTHRLSPHATIIEFFEQKICDKLKKIELSGLCFNDDEFLKLVTCWRHSKSSHLEVLNISENSQLSSAVFNIIFENLPQLRTLIALNCRNLLKNLDKQKISKFPNIPMTIYVTKRQLVNYNDVNVETFDKDENYLIEYWSQHWGNRAKIDKRYPYLLLSLK